MRAVGSTQKFETGAAIIRSGSVDNTLYILLAGLLKVEFSEQAIHLAVGDVVGEMAFLDNHPRTATVRADTNCSLLVLEREPTFRALSAQPLLLKENKNCGTTHYPILDTMPNLSTATLDPGCSSY